MTDLEALRRRLAELEQRLPGAMRERRLTAAELQVAPEQLRHRCAALQQRVDRVLAEARRRAA